MIKKIKYVVAISSMLILLSTTFLSAGAIEQRKDTIDEVDSIDHIVIIFQVNTGHGLVAVPFDPVLLKENGKLVKTGITGLLGRETFTVPSSDDYTVQFIHGSSISEPEKVHSGKNTFEFYSLEWSDDEPKSKYVSPLSFLTTLLQLIRGKINIL